MPIKTVVSLFAVLLLWLPDPSSAEVSRLGSDAFTHVGGAYRVAYSSDGRWLASSSEYGIKILSAITGSRMAAHNCYAVPGYLAFSPSEQSLLCAVAWGNVVRLGLDGSVLKRSLVHQESLSAITVSGDGRLVAVGSRSGSVTVAKARTLRPKWSVRIAGEVLRLVFTPDGKHLMGLSDGVKVWNVADGSPVADRLGLPNVHGSKAVAFSGDGKRVALDVNGDVQIFEVPSGRKVTGLGPSGCQPRALWFVDALHQLVSANERGNVEVWDTRTLESVNHWQVPLWRTATGADLSRDGMQIAFATGSIRIDVLRMKDGASVLDARPGHHGLVVAAAWLPDGRGMITAGTDRKLLRWDLGTGMVVAQRVLISRVAELAVDPRGRWVAVSDVNGGVALHAMDDLSAHRKLGGGDKAVRRLAFDPHGTTLAAAVCGSTLVAWDLSSGVERFRMTDSQSEELEINGLVYSSDGRLLTAGWDGRTRW